MSQAKTPRSAAATMDLPTGLRSPRSGPDTSIDLPLYATLIEAVKRADCDTVAVILAGADLSLDCCDQQGIPLLSCSVYHPPMLNLLIVRGAKLETPDHFGHTALTWAVCGNHEESVFLLLRAGAQITRQIRDATWFRFVAIEKLLLSSMMRGRDGNRGWGNSTPRSGVSAIATPRMEALSPRSSYTIFAPTPRQ